MTGQFPPPAEGTGLREASYLMLSPGPVLLSSLWRVAVGSGPVPQAAHAARHTVGAELQPASGTPKILSAAGGSCLLQASTGRQADDDGEGGDTNSGSPTLAPALQGGSAPDRLITLLSL